MHAADTDSRGRDGAAGCATPWIDKDQAGA